MNKRRKKHAINGELTKLKFYRSDWHPIRSHTFAMEKQIKTCICVYCIALHGEKQPLFRNLLFVYKFVKHDILSWLVCVCVLQVEMEPWRIFPSNQLFSSSPSHSPCQRCTTKCQFSLEMLLNQPKYLLHSEYVCRRKIIKKLSL